MQFYDRGERRAAGIPAGQKVNPDLLFRLFLRSKSLMQDSTLGPNCGTIRVCPAAENLPILPPFLFPEGAPSAEKVRALRTASAAGMPLRSPGNAAGLLTI